MGTTATTAVPASAWWPPCGAAGVVGGLVAGEVVEEVVEEFFEGDEEGGDW